MYYQESFVFSVSACCFQILISRSNIGLAYLIEFFRKFLLQIIFGFSSLILNNGCSITTGVMPFSIFPRVLFRSMFYQSIKFKDSP